MSAPPPANEPNEPGEPSRPIVRSRWTRRDRFWVAALALAAIAFYAGLGALLHPFAIPGPEWDGYVARARDLASGGTGYSATHPYGLPVLLAGLQLAGLDAFVAGRLVAAVAGGVLVAATCRLARDYVGWPAALVGALAVGVTGVVCEHAMLACSDMPAAGALAFALVCWSAAARRSDAALGPVALGGVGVGLAMAFRFPSLFAAAGLLVLLATGPWSRRALRALAAGAGAVLGLLPQLWASARASGALFGNDNWRNLVFKYQHGFDLRLAVLERDQAAAQLAAHWHEWLGRGLGDVVALFGRDLATPFVPSWPVWLLVPASWVLTAALLRGLVLGDRAARALALAALAAGFGTAMTFLASGRFVLPLLLPVTVLTLALAQRLLRWCRAPLAFALALLAAVAFELPGALADFARRHGRPEMAAIEQLARANPGLCNVLTVVMVDPFEVSAYITEQPGLADAAGRSPAELWQRVATAATRMATDYAVIARATAPVLVDGLLAVPPPAGYEVLRRDDVLVVRCPSRADDWLAGAAVERDGDEVVLQLAVAIAPTDVLMASLLMRDSSFRWRSLDLRPDPAVPNRFVRRDRAAAMPDGELTFVPAILQRDTAFLHGAPIVQRFR